MLIRSPPLYPSLSIASTFNAFTSFDLDMSSSGLPLLKIQRLASPQVWACDVPYSECEEAVLKISVIVSDSGCTTGNAQIICLVDRAKAWSSQRSIPWFLRPVSALEVSP